MKEGDEKGGRGREIAGEKSTVGGRQPQQYTL